MALIIDFVNISDLANISDYEANAWINARHIAGPFVIKGHKRSDGWEVLVKKFALELNEHQF